MLSDGQQSQSKGERAEEAAEWYFRLNGFLSIPGYVVHPDQPRSPTRTEADLMGVRFPHSAEKIGGVGMPDDRLLTRRARADQVLFILVEVKAGLCGVNGPWSREEKGNMQRAVSRLGFVGSETELDRVANAMYRSLRWEDHDHVLQYVSVGARENPRLSDLYPDLVQITWEDIGRFLYRRFKEFPQKLNLGPIHRQWPKFGRDYGEYSRTSTKTDSVQAVGRYIQTGGFTPDPGQ